MRLLPSRLWILALSLPISACQHPDTGAFSGYAEADLIYLAPEGGGILQTLKVERGDHIAQGTTLFQVDNTPESFSKEASVAQQNRASSQLADLSKGRRPEEIKALQAQWAQARAALDVSTSMLNRQRDLVHQGFISQARLDELVSAQARDAAALKEVEAQLALARQASRPDTIEAAKADVAAARAQVSQSTWAEAQKSRAAPSAATVFDVLYRPGEWVAPGSPVVVLLADHSVKVRFFVPEAALSQTKVGAMVQYQCDGCTAGKARIRYISPQAEFTPPVIYSNESKGKLVFMVEAWPEDQAASPLKPGQPLTVSLVS